MAVKTYKLTDDELVGRVAMGIRHMRKFVSQDRSACSRFRDPSTVPQWIDHDEDEPANMEGDEVAEQTTIGQPNQLTVNILTKEAAITINDPDWVVTAPDVEVQKIGRQYLRQLWKNKRWKRRMRKAALKRWVAGLGMVSYRWDALDGPCGEQVQTWNLSVDPHHNDWLDLRWAAWRIKMPLREARARYPDKLDLLPEPHAGSSEVETTLDSDRIFVWLYFSKDQTYEKGEEAHILGDRFGVQKEVLFRKPNLYEKVPLLIIQGDIDPGPSEFPLSDHMLAQGLQAELSDINQIISNKAKHGGPKTFYAPSKFTKAAAEAMESSVQQGAIPVKGILSTDQPPVLRVAGEPIMPSEIEAKREAQQALDAATGVTQYQRGVLQNNTKFATEAALLANQSGARALKERSEYEDFMNMWAETMVWMCKKFGGRRRDRQIPQEQEVLWESLQQIEEVRVIESCMATGTLVDTPNGPTPIETLEPGDYVWSALGLDKVVNKWRRTHKDLYRISTSRGKFYTSFNHPFFVPVSGWVAACDLSEGDILETREALFDLQPAIHMRTAKGDFWPQGTEVLQFPVQNAAAVEYAGRSCQDDGGRTGTVYEGYSGDECRCSGNDTRTAFGSREICKQDEFARGASEGVCYTQTDRQDASGADGLDWRSALESLRSEPNGNSLGRSTNGRLGIRVRDFPGRTRSRLSDELHSRSCYPGIEDGNRSGWCFAQGEGTEGPGQKEGTETLRARVESVEILEPGSPEGARYRDSQGQYVTWDIEIAFHPSFFVSGVLVHNSTTYKDPSLQQQQALTLYNTELQSMQLWLAMAGMGIADKIPNLVQARERLERAFEITQVDETWIQAPQGSALGQQQQGKSPMERIDYKDAPPDIRRQMEQQAGMQPSQMEDVSPAQSKAMGSGETSGESMMPLVLQQHQQRHDLVSQLLKQHHEGSMKQAEIEQQKEALKHAARNGSNAK